MDNQENKPEIEITGTTQTEKPTAWWRYPAGVIAFWVLTFFGGSIVLIINAFTPYYARFMKGDLGYEVLRIATAPVGIVFACAALDSITERKHRTFCIIHYAIGAMVCGMLLLYNVLVHGEIVNTISYVLGAAAFIFFIVTINRH